jgi:putative ABC transport system permease protein
LRKLSIAAATRRTLWRFPLRSGLTILSAILGVSGALSAVNYALGGRQKLTDQLARMGTNILIVTPQQSRTIAGRARTGSLVTTLTETDYAAIRREVASLQFTSAFAIRSYSLKAGDLAKKTCVVVGIEPAYLAIKQWTVRDGSPFTPADMKRAGRVVLLGAAVARDLFDNASPVGQRVLINRVPFQVIGVMRERGQSLDAANEDDQVYVPLTTAMRRLANIDYFSGILLAVDRWQNMDQSAATTVAILRRRHRALGKQPGDFQLMNQKQLLDTQLAASAQLMFFVRWIGVATLSVSGLGILAISWIGVRERTREIGTRRALGATRADIFFQILWEAAVLSVLGCATGVALASQTATMMARWAAQPRVFDQNAIWLVLALASCFNLAFAAVSARGAATLSPIEAVRFE